MPDYRLQRFRGGWAIATYERGKRIERRQLPATGATEAAAQFNRLVAEYSKPERITVETVWDRYRADRTGRPIAATMGFERKAVLAHFGSLSPDEITDQTCRSYIATRRAAGATTARSGLSWATFARR